MAIASLICLFLSQLVMSHLVHSHCPKKFECGNITMSFPFTPHTHPDCGFHIVQCYNDREPQIGIQPLGHWYIKKQIRDKILIAPKFHQEHHCNAFIDLTLPSSPAISFVTRNVTMLKCTSMSNRHTLDSNLDHYTKFSKCKKYHGFDIYYNYSDGGISDVIGDHPPRCSIFRWPVGDPTFDPEIEQQLFNVLHEVSLNWNISETCDGCQREKKCIVDHKNYTCSKEKSKKWGFILGIVSYVVAFICIVCLVITIIWRRKKRINRNPSSKADVGFSSIFFGTSVYSYADLEEATNNFAPSRKLGDGGFGIVYYGKLRDGREVAVKLLYEHNYKRMEQFINEIRILASFRHPNLVQLYGCTSRRSQELLLVYEFAHNGTVADHLHGEKSNTKFLSCHARMNIAIQTATALTYLHKSDIIHRDVKTSNLLLDRNFHVKVADFGLSRLFPNNVTHISTAPQGTPGYVDPEYYASYQLTDKSDVYSFGVVLIELISSLPAVDVNRNRNEINLANLATSRIQRNEIDDLIDPLLGYRSDPEVYRKMSSVAELAFRCLQFEKEMRPEMDEVVEVLNAINDFKANSEIKKISEENDRSGEYRQLQEAIDHPLHC